MALQIFETEFKHDWNTREGMTTGKLNCRHFTTLRKMSAKYAPQTIHRIINNNNKKKREILGYTVVIRNYPLIFKDLEKYDILCRLDTGYGFQDTKTMLRRMYQDLKDEQEMCFVLMRYLTKAEIERLNEKLKSENQPSIF